jgi:hypothetical protein
MQTCTGILFQQLPHESGLVNQEIVGLLTRWTPGNNLLQEVDKVPTGVSSGSCSVNAAGCAVHRPPWGMRSMPVLFRSLGAAQRNRQHRLEPIKRLNTSLFIDAEQSCMLRWFRYRAVMSAASV